jgi:hypothetical protein
LVVWRKSHGEAAGGRRLSTYLNTHNKQMKFDFNDGNGPVPARAHEPDNAARYAAITRSVVAHCRAALAKAGEVKP